MKNISINPEDYTILAVDDIATNIMLLKDRAEPCQIQDRHGIGR